MAGPLLEVCDLAGRRGYALLFTGLSFAVQPGEILVVSGPNGTGKTTLLRMLAGLTAPETGEIRLRGQPVAPFSSALREAVAYAGHAPAVKDELNAEENLRSLVALAGAAIDAPAAARALGGVALERQRGLPARVLSAGQRRRIGLARLTLVKRALWVLDEPTTALDADGIDLLGTLVRAQLGDGGAVIAATHHPFDAGSARLSRLELGG